MQYPTFAEFNRAGYAEIVGWARTLPPPQTDVERTIHRRLVQSMVVLNKHADLLLHLQEMLRNK